MIFNNLKKKNKKIIFYKKKLALLCDFVYNKSDKFKLFDLFSLSFVIVQDFFEILFTGNLIQLINQLPQFQM